MSPEHQAIGPRDSCPSVQPLAYCRYHRLGKLLRVLIPIPYASRVVEMEPLEVLELCRVDAGFVQTFMLPFTISSWRPMSLAKQPFVNSYASYEDLERHPRYKKAQ